LAITAAVVEKSVRVVSAVRGYQFSTLYVYVHNNITSNNTLVTGGGVHRW